MLKLLEHNGVQVFCTYKEGDPGNRVLTFTFSTANDGDDFGPKAFDVRQLPTWRGTGEVVIAAPFMLSPEGDEIERAVREAIDLGLLPMAG